MALKIIGSGFGRTGTMSTKLALESLGFGPCRHRVEVRATIPADRLLVFTPADGWPPLCKFLGVAVPDAPFPKTYASDEFCAHFGGEPADAVV